MYHVFIVETKGHRFWAYKVFVDSTEAALRRAESAFPDPVNVVSVGASGSADVADGHYDKACRKAEQQEAKHHPVTVTQKVVVDRVVLETHPKRVDQPLIETQNIGVPGKLVVEIEKPNVEELAIVAKEPRVRKLAVKSEPPNGVKLADHPKEPNTQQPSVPVGCNEQTAQAF